MFVNPQDPFPLLEPNQWSYQEEQRYSQEVDSYLGLAVAQTEAQIKLRQRSSQQEWTHVDPAVFLTPYTEIRQILSQLYLTSGQTIVDLGAGYGRMAFVLARHYPGVNFLGLELARERVDEGNRILVLCGHNQAKLVCEDLTQISPPAAAVYFLYDYGHREAIAKTLEDLKGISSSGAICVVARGGAVRSLIQKKHLWLCDVVEPRHYPHYSIYFSP